MQSNRYIIIIGIYISFFSIHGSFHIILSQKYTNSTDNIAPIFAHLFVYTLYIYICIYIYYIIYITTLNSMACCCTRLHSCVTSVKIDKYSAPNDGMCRTWWINVEKLKRDLVRQRLYNILSTMMIIDVYGISITREKDILTRIRLDVTCKIIIQIFNELSLFLIRTKVLLYLLYNTHIKLSIYCDYSSNIEYKI